MNPLVGGIAGLTAVGVGTKMLMSDYNRAKGLQDGGLVKATPGGSMQKIGEA